LALSVAPTAIHSHYRGARGSIPSPAPPPKKTERRPAAEERILSDLWLMSAASFRRAGKHGQSLVAIEEAENHDPENPNVWVQLGLLQLAEFGAASGGPDAIKAFTKALLLKSDHPPAVVCMARLNMAQGDVDLAHSLLWQLTEDRGWDVPEAWVALAQAVEKQGRAPRAKECLLEALRLERRRACRPIGDALKD
jgi:predicted Zn-dependent protease